MISAHTARRRPVSGSPIRPRRPKSISATSPGALSSIRTVVALRLCQPRRRMNRPHRRVRDLASTSRKQLVDAGHLQPIGRQPRVHLVGPRSKLLVGRRLNLPRAAQGQPHQAGQLIFTRNRAVSCQARLHPRPDVSTDCLPRQSRTASYLPLTLTGLPAAYHFCYLHSRHLPVRHRRSLHQGCSYGRQSGVRGGPPH